jgi:glucose-1-phosphate cytidylyltransferase
MRVIILAGGFGTRLSEETEDKPKPMVQVGEKPILWHLMSSFSKQGFNDFVLALGYKSEVIKRWLIDISELDGDLEVNTDFGIVNKTSNKMQKAWNVVALDTGLNAQTGGRIKRCMDRFPNERVIVTYGDGLANVSIQALIEFHEMHGKFATVTAVRPPARFGYMQINQNRVQHFGEKNQMDEGWINGGYFVLEPEVSTMIRSIDEPFETGALPRLAEKGQLMAFEHVGFWQPMDTLREKKELSKLAELEVPPWLNLQSD